MSEPPHVRLRPLSLDTDLDAAIRWYSDPEVLHFSEGAGTPAYDERTVRRMYEHLASEGEVLMVEAADVDGVWKLVGDAVLHPDTLPIVIGDAGHRGRGIGSAALRLLIARARSRGWNQLHARKVFADNYRSRRMFASAGFREIGRAHDEHGRETIRLILDLA